MSSSIIVCKLFPMSDNLSPLRPQEFIVSGGQHGLSPCVTPRPAGEPQYGFHRDCLLVWMKMLLHTQPPSQPHTLAQGWLFDEHTAARCKRAQIAHGAEIPGHAVLHEL